MGNQAAVIKFLLEAINYFFFLCSSPALWMRSPYAVVSWSTFNGVKRPVHETQYSPPSNEKVKNEWSCSSISKYAFMTSTLKLYHLPNQSFMEFNAMLFQYVCNICTYVYIPRFQRKCSFNSDHSAKYEGRMFR